MPANGKGNHLRSDRGTLNRLSNGPAYTATKSCSVHARSVQNVSPINAAAQPAPLNQPSPNNANERVLAALRAKNGVLFGSQAVLGRAFGWSNTRANEGLHQMQDAGRPRLSITSRGYHGSAYGGVGLEGATAFGLVREVCQTRSKLQNSALTKRVGLGRAHVYGRRVMLQRVSGSRPDVLCRAAHSDRLS